ncbi:MAG: lysophospholipid acyltransferase family protein [Pseudomonadota bacterium]
MRHLRAAAFYVGYTLATVVWGTLSVLVGWLLPYRWRFRFIIGCWTWFCLAWLRLTCGIRQRVTGRENLPEDPCIVMARHESTWETLFLQRLFSPQATLIKRELLHIPFFGWAFRLLRPIAIDRKRHRQALKTLIREGAERLSKGIWVVLFPEGTRMPAGVTGRFHPGGAALAAETGSPILVVVHNSGTFWPAHALAKRPGEIQVIISEPITTAGLSSKEIQAAVAETFDALRARLPRAPGDTASPAPETLTRPDSPPEEHSTR